ncbi:38K [Cotesia congregata filamentous virus 1]|uniref:38K n=1 Tax=Cotesia congregata filamentous virus 1 TaxID=3064291 RepID=A0ABC8QJR3_9VIRU|nr:38K [Cotesia congregata filamentous virus 1]
MSFAYPFACIVVDLDETLIDKEYAVFDGAIDFLSSLFSLTPYVCLWSAGNDVHINKFFKDPEVPSHVKTSFFSIFSGEANGTKDAELVQKIIKKKRPSSKVNEFILIDDKIYKYKDNNYTLLIDVNVYTKTTTGRGVKFVQYSKILKRITQYLNKKIIGCGVRKRSKKRLHSDVETTDDDDDDKDYEYKSSKKFRRRHLDSDYEDE